MTRYGLVGTGHWAATTHAPALADRSDGALVGVWGRTPAAAQDLADRHGARAMDSPAELFEACDVVTFAVPPHVQAPLAVEAAAAGCHLLLEKPVALDPTAADEVADAVADHGVASVVFFTARFQPEVAAWLDATVEQGPWLGGRTTWFGANSQPDSPYRDSAWRLRAGALWDVGPHALAFLLPLLGPVGDVAATPGPGDLVNVALHHASGAGSAMALGLTMPPAAVRVETDVYGPSGWSSMPPMAGDPVPALGRALDQLVASAADGTPHPCDAAFGRDVVHVLDRVEATLG
jgi:predicted dehydrogenase